MDITALLTLPMLPGQAMDTSRPAPLRSFGEVLAGEVLAGKVLAGEVLAEETDALTALRGVPSPSVQNVLPEAAATPPPVQEDASFSDRPDTLWPIQTLALMANLPTPVTPLATQANTAPATAPGNVTALPLSHTPAPDKAPRAEPLMAATQGDKADTLPPPAPRAQEDVFRPLPTVEPASAPVTRDAPVALPAFSPASSPVAAPAPALAMAAPLGSSEWPAELGRQLMHFATGRHGEHRVTLQLNPAHLGPVSISLVLDEQSAQAQFFSAHAPVRQVLEQAIPQLREALAEQGIQLGEASVGDQRSSQESPPPPHLQPGQLADNTAEADAVLPVAASLSPGGGAIDLYA